MTVKIFEEKILKGDLAMVAPDVEIDGRGVVIISSGGSARTDIHHAVKLCSRSSACHCQ